MYFSRKAVAVLAAVATMCGTFGLVSSAVASAPTLTAEKTTLHWTHVPSTSTKWNLEMFLKRPPLGEGAFYSGFPGEQLSATPEINCTVELPCTVTYRIREYAPVVGEWSNSVTIKYPYEEPPVNTAVPTISGTAQQGKVLTEAHGTWTNSPTSYAYQWEQCNSLGESCLPISGASSQTYTVTVGDVGHKLKVQETASNSAGAGSPATSAATATVIAETPSMIVSVDGGGWNSESATADMAGAVKYVRASYYNYREDSQENNLVKAGLTLLPLFGEEYEGHTTLASFNNSTFTNEIIAWFKKYGKGGTFWAGKTDKGATTLELMNEPGNPFFYTDCCTTEGHKIYAEITKNVKAAIEANFTSSLRPKILVSYDGGYNGSEYGEAVFAAGAVADGVTVHPYGGHTTRAKSAEGNRARVTQAHEKTGLPVYVTEVGWPTCGETGDSLNWTEAEQAENITNFGAWARSLGYVADFTNFNYADYSSGGKCYGYGIVNSTATVHKLSYNALKGA